MTGIDIEEMGRSVGRSRDTTYILATIVDIVLAPEADPVLRTLREANILAPMPGVPNV